MTRPRAFIVANVMPRWVSDFNEVSSWLADHGFDVTVMASAPDPGSSRGWRSPAAVASAEAALHPDVEVRYLPYRTHQVRPLVYLRTLLIVLQAAIFNPDALFVIWTTIPILSWGPVLRVLRRRALYLVTGLGPVFADQGTSRRRRRLVELVYGLSFRTERCRILVHNRDDKSFLCRTFGLPDDRVRVTPGCGVDPAAFPFSPRRTDDHVPIVLVPVRLLVDKGVIDAAEASNLLADEGIAHEMWFTSNLDPSHPTALTQDDVDHLAATTPNARFLGYQDSLVERYDRCDVVCIPSYFPEGLPTALIEAASIGRPIVTCDNVGGRDFIRDGVDGIVVPPKSPEALGAALRRLLTDRAEADRMLQSAHQRFLDGYTKQDMLDITVAAMADIGVDPATGVVAVR